MAEQVGIKPSAYVYPDRPNLIRRVITFPRLAGMTIGMALDIALYRRDNKAEIPQYSSIDQADMFFSGTVASLVERRIDYENSSLAIPSRRSQKRRVLYEEMIRAAEKSARKTLARAYNDEARQLLVKAYEEGRDFGQHSEPSF